MSKGNVVSDVNYILENGIKILKGLPLIEISRLKRHPNNIKKHSKEQIKNLMELMKIVGFKDPIVIDKKENVKAGHGRLDAAELLGMTRVPYVPLEGLTKKQMDLFMYMDNYVNESPWIDDNVQLLLEDIQLPDLNTFEVNWDEIIISDLQEETQEIPEPPITPKSKLGQIYQLGNHRVMCGDATKDTEKLINGITVHLLFTDPPYGISVVQSGGIGGDGYGFTSNTSPTSKLEGKLIHRRLYKKIIGDDVPFNPQFLLNYAKIQIIFGANHFSDKLPVSSHWLVWDKKQGDQPKYTDNFSDVELMWTSIRKQLSVKIYRHVWNGMTRAGDRKTELKDRVHPTQKPVGLFSDIIKDYSKQNDIVLDPYLGSGSTLIACEQTNRICYGMEIDPGYVDVIIQRWENFTGKKAVLVQK